MGRKEYLGRKEGRYGKGGVSRKSKDLERQGHRDAL